MTLFSHNGVNRSKNYTCWRTSAVFGRYLCYFSLLTWI